MTIKRSLRLALLLVFSLLLRRSDAWLPFHLRYFSLGTTSTNIATRLASSLEDDESSTSSSSTDLEEKTFLVEVTYEGRSCQVPIGASETLLRGLERARVPDQLAIPELPSECRRGNCLTCVARHTTDNSKNKSSSSLLRGEDGLAPYLSRQISQSGYILTCSSYVTGDGLQLELGLNDKAWMDVYQNRFYEESTQYAARKAMARNIRTQNEKNPKRWALETKTALEKSGEY